MWHIRCFKYANFDFDLENVFYQVFTNCYPIGSKMKNAQNLLKFVQADISNMPISILMPKMIYIKYLRPVIPKLFQN